MLSLDPDRFQAIQTHRAAMAMLRAQVTAVGKWSLIVYRLDSLKRHGKAVMVGMMDYSDWQLCHRACERFCVWEALMLMVWWCMLPGTCSLALWPSSSRWA